MASLPEHTHREAAMDTTNQRPATSHDSTPAIPAPDAPAVRSPQEFYETLTERADIRELLTRLAQTSDPTSRPEGQP